MDSNNFVIKFPLKDRHLARILAVQALYEADIRPNGGAVAVLERLLAGSPLDEPEFALGVLNSALSHLEEIDRELQAAAPERPLIEIGRVDHQILRLALAELLFQREVPPKVVLDEAVELAKEFGGESSYSFINGVLGTIYRSDEAQEGPKPSS